ncbi:CxC2 domain-containing protein [Mycena sanguinolenta]|uniref:CxC2 domain-containing protein n=1 Tax=Mycena sanguinolenta TaxID=230812 RepID=A0A8H6X862_9AGAR|nr:CxC2 domain-containing protein [Mycena sanguinolenta]
MESYNAARAAIISLNGSSNFPALTESDLFMKSVQQKRHVGDSKRTDGLLFRAAAVDAIGSPDQDGDVEMLDSTTTGDVITYVGTQMDRRQSGPKPKKKIADNSEKAPEQPDGWLWHLGKLAKMADAEMDAWAIEGDRVQRFRAEADMQRWQEQIEQKLAELLRTGRSFGKMQSVWSELATISQQDGATAYAFQKSAMYKRRAAEVDTRLRELGYSKLCQKGASLVSFIEEE